VNGAICGLDSFASGIPKLKRHPRPRNRRSGWSKPFLLFYHRGHRDHRGGNQQRRDLPARQVLRCLRCLLFKSPW